MQPSTEISSNGNVSLEMTPCDPSDKLVLLKNEPCLQFSLGLRVCFNGTKHGAEAIDPNLFDNETVDVVVREERFFPFKLKHFDYL